MEAVAAAINGESAPQTASVLLVASAAQGGIARHVVSLLEGLHDDGYQVAVAGDPEGPIAEAAADRKVPFYEIPISPGAGPSRAALAALQLAGAANALPAQVLHTHSFSAGLTGALAVPLARSTRLVATVHNYPPGGDGMRAARSRDRWAVRLLLRHASRLITVSDALRRDLLAVRPDLAQRTLTISNGVDIRSEPAESAKQTRPSLGVSSETPLVGMIARLAPQKGIEPFIQAAKQVLRHCPHAHFVLAGDGPLNERAHALRRELDLSDRLHLIGEVESARDLISSLDLLVVASISEGSSVVAMEAMALGKPVVATSAGGVPEVVADGETGLLVTPGDATALSTAICTLLNDRQRAGEMGERGRRRAAERFDVRNMVEQTQKVYADLLREAIEAGGKRS